MRSQLRFLSLPPSITVVSEKDNSIKNNKIFKYDSTQAVGQKTSSWTEDRQLVRRQAVGQKTGSWSEDRQLVRRQAVGQKTGSWSEDDIRYFFYTVNSYKYATLESNIAIS